MMSLARTRDDKVLNFSLAGYMQLTCTVKKLLHFKRKIADAKILHF